MTMMIMKMMTLVITTIWIKVYHDNDDDAIDGNGDYKNKRCGIQDKNKTTAP